jgi:subtilisin family serine protease
VQIASLIPGGGFGTADGSSFAAPWVAGAAALLRVRCPALTPDEIRERLMAESTPINALNPNHVAQLGAGMLNALRPLMGPCIIAPPACSLADITQFGGSADDPGAPDGQLTADDLIAFVNAYGDGC